MGNFDNSGHLGFAIGLINNEAAAIFLDPRVHGPHPPNFILTLTFPRRPSSNFFGGFMLVSRLLRSLLLFVLSVPSVLQSQSAQSAASNRIDLRLDTGEAEAVLAILDKRSARTPVTPADWEGLFATEPYIRLKKREASMQRDFSDDDFKTFVQSPELAAKAAALRQTLDAWKHADLTASARRVLTYLPDRAHIRAKIFPVIKPKTNSFVFETQTDPAIFLYLDPQESGAKFENTVAHELHHIGYSSINALAEEKQKDVPANAKPAVDWMGAFGEGFAVLAAAGGPDVDPHAASSKEEHARWDHDLANFNQDQASLQQFFLDVINQKLTGKDQIDEKAFSYFGDAQGAWYTVGYRMAVIVEKRFGRKTLINCMLDPRELLARYNRAAKEINKGGKETLPLWSPELIQKIGVRGGKA